MQETLQLGRWAELSRDFGGDQYIMEFIGSFRRAWQKGFEELANTVMQIVHLIVQKTQVRSPSSLRTIFLVSR